MERESRGERREQRRRNRRKMKVSGRSLKRLLQYIGQKAKRIKEERAK